MLAAKKSLCVLQQSRIECETTDEVNKNWVFDGAGLRLIFVAI